MARFPQTGHNSKIHDSACRSRAPLPIAQCNCGDGCDAIGCLAHQLGRREARHHRDTRADRQRRHHRVILRVAVEQRQRNQPKAQSATILLEGNPEQLELAWKQMSQYKNVQLVQQAGPQLRGLKYDSNAFRSQLLADKSRAENLARKTASADSASVGKAGRKPAPLAAGGKELAQKDKKQGAVDPAATRKLSNESGPIVIQLIIQVSE